MKVPLWFVVLLLLLSGCKAGSGEGLDEQGRPLEEITIPPENNVIQATLPSIQEHIFTPLCSTCHGGVNPAAGQNLSTLEHSIASLINVDSSNTLFKRVLPGSALESYLYLKVTGDSRAGARMPLGQPALDDESITAIRAWIDAGALLPQNNANMAKVSRINTIIAKIEPITEAENYNEAFSQLEDFWPAQYVLTSTFWFNKAMSFDYLTSNQILVHSYQSNAAFAQPILVADEHISLHSINSHSLQINVSGLANNISKLTIQLNDGSISTLTSQNGQQLDGDNDGIEGGAFHYEFTF